MLAHSPPLPIIIDHLFVAANITAAGEYKEGVLLGLKHRDRVRCIRLRAFVPSLARLVVGHRRGISDAGVPVYRAYVCVGFELVSSLDISRTMSTPSRAVLL